MSLTGFTGILGGQKNDAELIPDDGLDEILSQAADEAVVPTLARSVSVAINGKPVANVPKPVEEDTKPVLQHVREAVGVPQATLNGITNQSFPNDRNISINLNFNFGI